MIERARSLNRSTQLFTVVILVGLVSSGYAQSLVDPAWLAERMNESDVVLFHVGTPSGYARSHLPDARLITLADVSATESLRGPDPRPEDLTDQLLFEIGDVESHIQRLEALGVTDGSEIVLYGEPDQPLPTTTRVAVVLDYLGLGDNVHLLNGGVDAWLAAGYELSSSSTAVPATGSLSVRRNDALLADSRDVAAAVNRSGYKIIDTRMPVFYNGEQGVFGKTERIPGAINLPIEGLADDSGRFDEEQLTDAFQNAGIDPGDRLIIYCHVGMRATQAVFAAKLLGLDVRLYDGSFQDWVTNNRGDIEQ